MPNPSSPRTGSLTAKKKSGGYESQYIALTVREKKTYVMYTQNTKPLYAADVDENIKINNR